MSVKLFTLLALLSVSPLYAYENLTLVSGCRLYNLKGHNFKNFPGAICVFLEDGSFISTSDSGMRRISKDQEVLWELKGHFHHQVNLSHDKKRILAMDTAVVETTVPLRQDKLVVISLEGKILHEAFAKDILTQGKATPLSWSLTETLARVHGPIKEISHFNSIYEIPPQKRPVKNAMINEGDIVINSNGIGAFIMTADLKKVVKYIDVKNSVYNRLHDVQINERGNLILFNNIASPRPGITDFSLGSPLNRGYHSSPQEMDPVTQKIIRKFEATPKEMFYSWICGSIQELDDSTWLFTHFLNGTYIYSMKEQKLLYSIPSTHTNDERFVMTQQVKAYDLSKFLSHWK